MPVNWDPILFGVTMLGLVAGYVITRMALFIPLVALVLYLGVEFDLADWAVWVFWISVILALLFIPLALFWNVRKFIAFFGSIALAVSIFAAAFGTWSWDSWDNLWDNDNVAAVAAEVTSPVTEATTEPVPVPTTALDNECEYTVQLDPHTLNQVVSGGLTTPDTEALRARVLDLNDGDPNGLFLYHNVSPLGKTSPLESVQDLVVGDIVDGACYSEVGVRAFQEWSVLWRVAILTRVDAMPPGWLNTGVGAGGPSVGTPPSGDTSGVIATYPNSDTQHGVMDRCLNPVVPSAPPNTPPGETDEPDEPEEPEEPSGEHPTLTEECQQNGIGCPPGVTNDVVQPPQSNPGQPVGPTPGAPPAPYVPPPGPAPVAGTPAPAPVDGGYDSGSPSGSGTPGGSTSDSSGTTGGGPTPAAPGTPPVAEGDPAPIGGDPGGF